MYVSVFVSPPPVQKKLNLRGGGRGTPHMGGIRTYVLNMSIQFAHVGVLKTKHINKGQIWKFSSKNLNQLTLFVLFY